MLFRITGKMRFRELGGSSLATISVGASRNSVLRAQPTSLEGVCVNLPGAVSRQWRKVALASTLVSAGFQPPLTFGRAHALQPHAAAASSGPLCPLSLVHHRVDTLPHHTLQRSEVRGPWEAACLSQWLRSEQPGKPVVYTRTCVCNIYVL